MTRAYRFHPLERRGIVVGLGAGQLLTVAGGVVVALAALTATPGAGGMLVAAAALAGAGAIAVWPVAGRPVTAWLPVVAGFAGSRKVRLGGPNAQACPPGISLAELPAGPGEAAVGVVRDRLAGTWAAVVPLSGRAFTLLDDEDQAHHLAAWRALLAAAGRPGSPIRRIQWVERTRPADGLAEAGHLRATPVVSGLPESVRASYQQLVADAAGIGEFHEVLLVVAVRSRGGWSRGGAAGRSRESIGSVLRRELRLLQGQLRSTDLRAGAPLDAAGLAGALRNPWDAAVGPSSPRRGGRRQAWPMAAADGWGAARIEGRLLVTYWVAEWPRIDVGPDFLVPLLLAGGTRSVSLTMAPVPTARAVREVESARTADTADDELRRRAGFLPTARHHRQAEGARQREAELAEGHVELRFSGYVTVSADGPDELDQRCAEVEQAAQQCHLELRRLWGQQREAATWTLPIARGVR